MNRSFLATLAVALSLAVSPVTWARGGGGGGGHSGFSSSHASSSSHSSSSGSSLGSGFGSSRSNVSSSSASVSRSSPSLGTALYNSQASRQAAATYNRPAPAPAPVYTNAGGTGDYSGSASTGNRYNSPAPIVVHHYDNSGSGSSNFLFGWMLGHESSRSAPVVIEQRPSQPVYVQSGSMADTWSQPASNAGSSTGAIAPSVAHTGSQILHVLLWIAGIGVIGFASYRLWTNWSARKDSYTATNHYKL
ncbi:hypothetical protein KDX27_41690 [Burkholderia cenocepacia]|uniref:hypothetical protein n=1 Tax=Burkholderia cenocepacia TaxID=95486 RepID=UPI001B9AA87A|nr:hypothetical protein [Burkholderia cenocepacia]MBR8029265.1 hypothetical protein [Burkholderia cenocepacia]MBR8174184.1 hypothetical protein [Burkholderia cenocepacia]